MRPGSHVIILGRDCDALAARAEGLQLRDTLAVMLPGGLVLHAFLFRYPLASGMTVGQTALKYGSAAMVIDGCRIGAGVKQVSAGATTSEACYGAYAKGTGRVYTSEGRWPTNLLLVHGSGCKRVGDKRIVGVGSHGSVGGLRHNNTYAQDKYSKTYERTLRQCYTDAEGLETVAAYDCEPACPVLKLDRMSGELTSGHLDRASITAENKVYGKAPERVGVYEATSGGASRFYPQFASLSEAVSWMLRLIGGV